jgi:toxin-antitoxin system PIN domain toxin
MTCIADANVLFPLLVRGHVAHVAARTWWANQADGSVGTCLLTRLAVLRLLSNKVAMNGFAVSPDKALQAWQQLANDPRAFHVEAESASHEPRFAALVAKRDATPNLWTDAWLAALAMTLDFEVVTFDRGFKSFRGVRVKLLSVADSGNKN